jgi:hypothetical protein
MAIAWTLVFALGVLAASIGVFVWATRRIRKGGGGATVGVLGATYEMLSSDQRRAVETIVKRTAGESEEDQSSSDPLRPGAKRAAGGQGTSPRA